LPDITKTDQPHGGLLQAPCDGAAAIATRLDLTIATEKAARDLQHERDGRLAHASRHGTGGVAATNTHLRRIVHIDLFIADAVTDEELELGERIEHPRRKGLAHSHDGVKAPILVDHLVLGEVGQLDLGDVEPGLPDIVIVLGPTDRHAHSETHPHTPPL